MSCEPKIRRGALSFQLCYPECAIACRGDPTYLLLVRRSLKGAITLGREPRVFFLWLGRFHMGIFIAYALGVLTAVYKPPPPEISGNSRKCCHHKTPWWKITLEIGTFIAAVIAAVATGIYAYITHETYLEIQKQTNFVRQQIVGQQQAIVGIELGGVNENGLQIIPLAEGQIPPKDVHADFKVTRETFPDQQNIDLEEFSLDWPLLLKGSKTPSLTDQWTRRPFHNFSEVERERMSAGKVTIFVEVHFRYDNGFGDIIQDQFCTFYRPYINATGGHDVETHPCGEFPIWLREYNKSTH